MNVSQAVAAAPHLKNALDAIGGPKAIFGRFVGFGADEMDARVPGWAWVIIGAAAGGVAVWMGRNKIERLLDQVR
jgi:hypothetical protein